MKTNYPLLVQLGEAERAQIVKAIHPSEEVVSTNVSVDINGYLLHYQTREDRGRWETGVSAAIRFDEGYLPWSMWSKIPMSIMDVLKDLKIIEP